MFYGVDGEPSDSVVLKSGAKIKISHVPRRSLVGNEVEVG